MGRIVIWAKRDRGMEFTLIYRGPLKSNARPKDKQEIRRVFHRQLRKLWSQNPLKSFAQYLVDDPPKGEISVIKTIESFRFAPLVTEKLRLVAELEIILLRPEAPGSIVTRGGDIDNRLKTLLDSMRMPHRKSELPNGDTSKEGEDPFFCLLEDDNLITSISVKTDRLLEPVNSSSEVVLLVQVTTRATAMIIGNMGL